MDFSFSEEQKSIQEVIKQLLGDLVTDESLRVLKKEGKWFHEKAWKQLADAGMLGLAIPEEYGGGAMGLTELCLLLQEVGRTVAPIPALPMLVSAVLPLVEFGTEPQKRRLLPGVVQGTTFLTVAMSDLGTRNPLNPAARAISDNGGWRIHGVFTNVQYVDLAERVLLAAKTDQGGVVCVFVDPNADGVQQDPQRGTNDEPLTQLTLTDAPIEAADVLVGPENVEHALGFILDRTYLGQCALELGIAEQALIMTANYCAERKQFGVPIGTFQGVTQRVGDAYIDVQAMKVSMWQACWMLDQRIEAAKQIDVARFWAFEGGARVVAAAQHVHGGMGFDRDYPLYRYFLTSKHLEFTLGGAMQTLSRLGGRLADSPWT